MVRWMRTARAMGTKVPQAIQWAKELAEYLNTKHGAQLTVYLDIFGEYPTMRWFTDAESLAALEQRTAPIMADPGYWQFVAKTADLFIESSITDTITSAI